jgi:hypothetical protein
MAEPFRYVSYRRLEFFNEACTLSWCHLLVVFTDFVPDPQRRYDMGFVFICLIGLNVFVNLAYIYWGAPKRMFELIVKGIKYLVWYFKKAKRFIDELTKKPAAPQL